MNALTLKGYEPNAPFFDDYMLDKQRLQVQQKNGDNPNLFDLLGMTMNSERRGEVTTDVGGGGHSRRPATGEVATSATGGCHTSDRIPWEITTPLWPARH